MELKTNIFPYKKKRPKEATAVSNKTYNPLKKNSSYFYSVGKLHHFQTSAPVTNSASGCASRNVAPFIFLMTSSSWDWPITIWDWQWFCELHYNLFALQCSGIGTGSLSSVVICLPCSVLELALVP